MANTTSRSTQNITYAVTTVAIGTEVTIFAPTEKGEINMIDIYLFMAFTAIIGIAIGFM